MKLNYVKVSTVQYNEYINIWSAIETVKLTHLLTVKHLLSMNVYKSYTLLTLLLKLIKEDKSIND